MMRKRLVQLLEHLLLTHAPSGIEQEMDVLVKDELATCGAEIAQDPRGNIHVRFPGVDGTRKTVVSAHKDELAVMVHRIDPDGKLWLEPLGGCRPAKYGEGPFDLVTGNGVIEGVLCIGSTHCSALSTRVQKARTEALDWTMVYLDCKLDADQLKERGAMVGDRALPGRRRKQPFFLGDDYVCGYALDDKGAVAVALVLAEMLRDTAPRHDVVVAFTAGEEGGASGAAFLARSLDPEDFIAIEVAPMADEYPTKMDARPVLLFKDGFYEYSHALTHEIMAAAKRRGIACQSAVARAFGSDASVTARAGLNGRAACIGYPTENTHGYEITRIGALENCVKVLLAHLTGP